MASVEKKVQKQAGKSDSAKTPSSKKTKTVTPTLIKSMRDTKPWPFPTGKRP